MKRNLAQLFFLGISKQLLFFAGNFNEYSSQVSG